MKPITRRSNSGMAMQVAANIDEVSDSLTALERRKLPYILRDAINDVAFGARKAESNKIRRSFDRPKSFTVKSPKVRKATPQTLTASVFIRDEAPKGNAPAKYIAPQVHGGPRRAKGFEVRLRRLGLLGPNEFAIPAIGYRRDRYGGITGNKIVQILAQLERHVGVDSTLTETKRSGRRNVRQGKARYFVPTGRRMDRGINRLPRGIYERKSRTKIKAVFIFVEGAPKYRKRYAFGKPTEKYVRRNFAQRFNHHLANVRP
ncbi:hypothetical protein [Maritalea myrionectae]|uniref:hypothetical protein n=1 Tax=Maritalea myrionectae TaxID=454601 RepID=UPI0003F8EFD2|nr:hypothetical protein [Maritalea myrionectae]